MATTGSGRPGWRHRWAAKENLRRQQAYAAALAAWQRRDEQVRRLVEAARDLRPDPGGAGDAALRLARDEAVYWTGPGAMIEPAYEPALRPPGHPDQDLLPAGPAPAGAGVAARHADVGSVTVTTRRVVFLGRSRREWAFGKLTGIAHTAAGQTLMRVSNRVRVSGVVVPPDAVPDFRLHLALAMADSAGERLGLVARLQEQVTRHQAARPQPAAPVGPEQAPATAWFGPGVLAAVAASAVLLVGLCCVGAVLSGNGTGLSTRDSGAAAATSPSPAPPPAPSPRPSPAPSPSASPSPSPAAGPQGADSGAAADRAGAGVAAAAAGDCAAYADSDDWCVDGIGDYDCEGGSGNGPHYAPTGVRVRGADDPFGLDDDGDGEGCEPYRAPPPPPPGNPPPPPPADNTDPRFGTCAAAIAAGYGPYVRGQDPEYHWYRDADNDGVVCE